MEGNNGLADASAPTALANGRQTMRTSRMIKGTSMPKPPNVDGHGLISMLKHPLSWLLICFPLGLWSEHGGLGDVVVHVLELLILRRETGINGEVVTFVLNFFALIPLAKILGDATEELAAGLKNDMLAGLLNATFGNAVEVVIMVQSLRGGLIRLVKRTLLGSILSNLLLVLGMSFFLGGIVGGGKRKPMHRISRTPTTIMADGDGVVADSPGLQEETYTELVGEKVQTFSVLTALVNTSMLLLSCLTLSLVTIFYEETHKHDREGVTTTSTVGPDEEAMNEPCLPMSRVCSIIILMSYAAYIFFQLVTHRGAMAEGDDNDEGDGEEEAPVLSIPESIAVMLVVTLLVFFSSECLVNAVEGVVNQIGISEHFIGIILLPIVGNACEHVSAIRFAMMDKPGLSIGIAVGSSTQIALFVVPFAVLTGWAMGAPMDLHFGSLNTTVLIISVIVVLSVVVDGTANWLQGYLLMSAYMIAAVLYWHMPNNEMV